MKIPPGVPIDLDLEIKLREDELNRPESIDQPQKAEKKQSNYQRKTRKGLATKNVSIVKLYKRILTMVERETAYLMSKNFQKPLDKDEALMLNNYAKLLEHLIDLEERLTHDISTEELERIANNSTKPKKPKTPPNNI